MLIVLSRQWRCLAEDPLLWREFVLCLDSSSDLALLPDMDRFSLVRYTPPVDCKWLLDKIRVLESVLEMIQE